MAVRVNDWGVFMVFELLAFVFDEDGGFPFPLPLADVLLSAGPLLLFNPGLDLNRDKISCGLKESDIFCSMI